MRVFWGLRWSANLHPHPWPPVTGTRAGFKTCDIPYSQLTSGHPLRLHPLPSFVHWQFSNLSQPLSHNHRLWALIATFLSCFFFQRIYSVYFVNSLLTLSILSFSCFLSAYIPFFFFFLVFLNFPRLSLHPFNFICSTFFHTFSESFVLRNMVSKSSRTQKSKEIPTAGSSSSCLKLKLKPLSHPHYLVVNTTLPFRVLFIELGLIWNWSTKKLNGSQHLIVRVLPICVWIFVWPSELFGFGMALLNALQKHCQSRMILLSWCLLRSLSLELLLSCCSCKHSTKGCWCQYHWTPA